MIIDTDVLIWYLRGNDRARHTVENEVPFSISVVTYIELVQGMRNTSELKIFQRQTDLWNIDIIHIDTEISSRAMLYIQNYSLSHSMALADALIAATAVRKHTILLTANTKHYRYVPDIELKKFNER
ncbi:MAG: type II toxin-antitoxin system VapC family toxin [Chitinivibrionales bacterium]|nr:type II toxin-antitoxin system VapC family toxin [Chitinivibrionales bacterium]